MPTPRHTWYHKETDYQGLVIDEVTGATIAVTYAKDTAAVIAREHNARAGLLEACQLMLSELEQVRKEYAKDNNNCSPLVFMARAAIAAAEGE